MLAYQVIAGCGQDRHGVALTATYAKNAIYQARKIAAIAFGGYTVHETVGGWVNPAGETIHEPGVSFLIIAGGLSEVEKFAQVLGHLLGQESVLLIAPDGRAVIFPIDYKADDAA